MPDRSKGPGDFCQVVSVGEDVEMDLNYGDLVLRPVGLYEYHDEDTDEFFIVVKEDDICAFGVPDYGSAENKEG